jgi:hypothetical protein
MFDAVCALDGVASHAFMLLSHVQVYVMHRKADYPVRQEAMDYLYIFFGRRLHLYYVVNNIAMNYNVNYVLEQVDILVRGGQWYGFYMEMFRRYSPEELLENHDHAHHLLSDAVISN